MKSAFLLTTKKFYCSISILYLFTKQFLNLEECRMHLVDFVRLCLTIIVLHDCARIFTIWVDIVNTN